MNFDKIIRLNELGTEYTDQAAALLVDSFYSMFQGISKDKAVLKRLFAACLRADILYVLLKGDQLAGFISVSDAQKRAVKINQEVCISIFGKAKGKILTWQLGKILGTPAVSGSESGYIDFIATAPEFRRTGGAAALLQFAEEHLGFSELYLDVLASNTPAIRLYEKMGYKTDSVKNSILMRIAGIKKMFIMKKTCKTSDSI